MVFKADRQSSCLRYNQILYGHAPVVLEEK